MYLNCFLGPPSAPRNAISNVNETSVFLEWSIPVETGGRKDIRYNILCRRVLPDGRGLEECGPNVRFLPRRLGLSNTSVMVADLQSHTNYSFLLEAINGVSELAKDHAKQYVTLNVTTNQAGMLHLISVVITEHCQTLHVQFTFQFVWYNRLFYTHIVIERTLAMIKPFSCRIEYYYLLPIIF